MLTINKGIQQSAVKVVVYGVEGIGKTTFASHFPAPLFLDLDRGSRRMDVDRIDSIQDWSALMGTLDQIQRDPSLPYSTIVIDTADMAAKLASAYICKANGNKKSIEEFGYGKGYVILAEEFSKLLVNAEVLVNMGFNVVFLAHAMQRTVTRPDDTGSYDHWEMKLPGSKNNSLGALLKEWADLLLFADYKVIIRQGADGKGKAAGGQRRMRATHTPFADAKNRFGLADILDFDFKEIQSIIPARPVTPPKTTMEKAYQAKKKVQKGITPKTAAEPAEAKPAPPTNVYDELARLMALGVSEADPSPITEGELLKAIREVDPNEPAAKAENLTKIPADYVEALIKPKTWAGFKYYVLNNIRTPF